MKSICKMILSNSRNGKKNWIKSEKLRINSQWLKYKWKCNKSDLSWNLSFNNNNQEYKVRIST